MSHSCDFDLLPGESWWGGAVNQGHLMPLDGKSTLTMDPDLGRENDQFAPFYVSSRGRFLWSDRPFTLTLANGRMQCRGAGEITLEAGHETLKGAYLAGCQAHFPFTGELPDARFFTRPQYNTWIELGTNQTTDEILRYARGIVDHGLPPGILMIDGGWQEDYGTFAFHKGKIPDPAQLIYDLHEMGFAVMVWVSPIVSCAGTQYKRLRDRGYLIRNAQGEIAIRKWWSGYSAVLDLSNPEAVEWYHGQLRSLQERYRVDGFKFDAGDSYFYADDDQIHTPMLAREQTALFNAVGARYPLNEFRAAWKSGGLPLVARLHDKYHSWDQYGINTLIPHTIVQGLLGYAYCCPDMVGGGILDCFTGGKALDEELFVRWAQANVYLGMMQMSVSPWRVLRPENAALVVDALRAHAALGPTLYDLACHAARTGEPLVRAMDYEFPGQGLERAVGQFMLGSDLLAAPVLERGAQTKTVWLPRGEWQGWDGRRYSGGGPVTLPVTMKDIPHFTRL